MCCHYNAAAVTLPQAGMENSLLHRIAFAQAVTKRNTQSVVANPERLQQTWAYKKKLQESCLIPRNDDNGASMKIWAEHFPQCLEKQVPTSHETWEH